MVVGKMVVPADIFSGTEISTMKSGSAAARSKISVSVSLLLYDRAGWVI